MATSSGFGRFFLVLGVPLPFLVRWAWVGWDGFLGCWALVLVSGGFRFGCRCWAWVLVMSVIGCWLLMVLVVLGFVMGLGFGLGSGLALVWVLVILVLVIGSGFFGGVNGFGFLGVCGAGFRFLGVRAGDGFVMVSRFRVGGFIILGLGVVGCVRFTGFGSVFGRVCWWVWFSLVVGGRVGLVGRLGLCLGPKSSFPVRVGSLPLDTSWFGIGCLNILLISCCTFVTFVPCLDCGCWLVGLVAMLVLFASTAAEASTPFGGVLEWGLSWGPINFEFGLEFRPIFPPLPSGFRTGWCFSPCGRWRSSPPPS